MRILDTRQMQEADRRTIHDLGVPAIVLMENAGAAVVDAIASAFGPVDGLRVAVISGRGNNGGDGFVVARLLTDRGADVRALLVGSRDDVRGAARTALADLLAAGVAVTDLSNEADWQRVAADVGTCALVVDAMVGTGFQPPLRGLAAQIATDVNRAALPVVAVDLPSGLSADTADVSGPAIRATFTVALGAIKLPLVTPPASLHAGRLVVAEIGIPTSVIDGIDGVRLEVMTRDDARRMIPVRRPDSHKGSYGHVVVVAGSRGKTGAAVLAARGALRSGAGLVTVATPGAAVAVVAAHDPEVMTIGLPETEQGTVAEGAADAIANIGADVIVAGPGLGTGPGTVALVGALMRTDVPLVLDADALNVIAASPDILHRASKAPVIITPHPGEMARLVSRSTADVQARRLETAREFAAKWGVVVVLKGHRTVVAQSDGAASFNMSGNPGMATPGAGDVLAGVIGAWLGQLGDVSAAARLGVYLHGLAGDLAAREVSQVAVTAGDIARHLGPAVLALTGKPSEDASA